ncbi:glycosyltransferase [Glycomyces sp. L485]|uniref:glycosyltransferase family 2 protein n=1 Tax=Glycomyces sp. L485 TaxID=2909235 RepID=UPI001F4BA671|nr:glycosyltransferase [Glycomyces sp. L485]MCH7232104.1 glycosyltransferase [Glycomyces sp. L485]
MNAPDVTVVTAVYNTMPYVTRCVESVLEQTLGVDRIELIAVDDGSTDTSGAELDRFAEAHPETVKVVHQVNSGGPANPSNVALELATGRYVFFLGSDDHLGPEALERMVNCADEHSSDVVMGLMVGVGGRRAPKTAFEQPGTDVPFPRSKLVWALSNTKLFRRDLVERLNLRFCEDVSVYSDVPFTIEAMANARKVSNLADYEYYYTVERENALNVTYSSKLSERLFAIRRIVDTICRLYEPGPERDALLYRTFAYEQWILLQEGFVVLDGAGRREICDGVADLADAHLTDEMRRRLPVQKRVRLALAQARDIPRLIEAIEFVEPVGFTVESGRAFARYPGFRDDAAKLDDETFELLGDKVTVRFARGVEPRRFVWTGAGRDEYAIEYSFSLPVEGIDAEAVKVGLVRLKGDKSPRKRTARPADEGAGPQIEADVVCEPAGDETVVIARMPCAELAAKAPGRWSLRGYIELGDFVYDLPLKSPHDRVQRQGLPRGVSVEWGDKRALAVRVSERATRRGLARLLRPSRKK